MITRQDMIYDFMIALSSNSGVYNEWLTMNDFVGGFGEHTKAMAEEMANQYLGVLI
jgi:hypothetical protein